MRTSDEGPTATMMSGEARHSHEDDWEGTHGDEDE